MKSKFSFMIVIVLFSLAMTTLACSSSGTPTAPAPANTVKMATDVSKEPSNTPKPITTEKPTTTSIPTDTPEPTETKDPNTISPGTYLVGVDIQPGLYRGYAGDDLFESCYWQRLKDFSGELSAILANDNAIGQFYVEVNEADYAFEVACPMTRLSEIPQASNFSIEIQPGTYLVGSDIKPGTYRGQAGADIMESCYWMRLKGLSGELYDIIANDNATGQFYIQVSASDKALHTGCPLTWVSD